jgi:hypothetical protein
MSGIEQAKVLPSAEARAFSRRAIISAAVLFFVLQAVGTVIAIANGWPAEAGVPGSPDRVARDFVTRGTALSGPLVVLLLLAVLIAAGRRHDRWGGVALVITIPLGAVAALMGAQEPITANVLQASPFGPFEALVLAVHWGSVISLLAVVLLSVLVIIDRARERQASGE